MRLKPVTLENNHVRLEPLDARHRNDLRAACDADTRLWDELYPFSMAGAHFDAAWDNQLRGGPTDFPMAVIVDGQCVGTSSFMTVDAANATVEIGRTYYAPDRRGGTTNPAAKRLMLAHAFDSGARRVSFFVDAINLRSRAAVLKLGATQEGVMRAHRVVWTGRVRDTVVFSVLADEWPAVRDGLDARLGARV